MFSEAVFQNLKAWRKGKCKEYVQLTALEGSDSGDEESTCIVQTYIEVRSPVSLLINIEDQQLARPKFHWPIPLSYYLEWVLLE